MPYTVKDYYRDFTKEHLDWLSPEERLEGIELKKRIQDVPPDDILRTLFPDDTGERVDAAKLERYLQELRQNPSGK